MAEMGFRIPGFPELKQGPQTYIVGVLRNFREASRALGRAIDILVVRVASSDNGGDPDYQIQTLDGEDAAAFSGATHEFLFDDITVQIDSDRLQDQSYTAEQVKDWLNIVNGESAGGGSENPILSDRWREADGSDPRD